MAPTPARYGTPRLRAYAVLSAVAVLGALVSGRPELAALGAPFALLLTAGLALSEPPQFELQVRLGANRVIQGDTFAIGIELSSIKGVTRLDLEPILGPGVAPARPLTGTVRLPPGQPVVLDFPLIATRWGACSLGGFRARAYDRFGMVRFDSVVGHAEPVKVLPDAGTLRSLIRPAHTEIFAGEVVSRRRGDGIEFSDVRSFAAGDRVRDVNWRATARAGELYVNQRLADRNADVVVFVDTFDELRPDAGEARTKPSSLDLAVSAAASVVAAYLRRRDRVGLVGWGGYLQWVAPGMGQVALYRIVDVLLEARVVRSDAWRGVRILPAGVLPPGALVVVLTPLLDPRMINALFDLRARGSDVAVIELDPVAFQSPGRRPEEQVAFRLWRLARQRIRRRLEDRGMIACRWDGGRPLEEVVRETEMRRRHYWRRSG
jgi:uncharacterized protein (DUF58 family)